MNSSFKNSYVSSPILAIILLILPLTHASSSASEKDTGVSSESSKDTGPSPGTEVDPAVEPPEKEHTLRSIFESWFPSSVTPQEPEATEEDGTGMPAAMESGSSPVVGPAELLSAEDLIGATPWRAPNYESQKTVLGYAPDVFIVPQGLKGRVGFWRDIYSKVTTDQGVLHDLMNVELVYATIDFGPIMGDGTLSYSQKARAREKLVDGKRTEIMTRIRSLHGRANSDGLSAEDLRIWKMFEPIKDPDKFLVASEKRRVRFQLGQRDKFIRGIFYSGRYLNEMETIFRDEGLPIELTRLPFVESSFDISALSKVGASGVWQFMRRTAKPYMKVNRDVDERNDPIKATRASARLLRENYMMLQSWPLAVTGYNHGAYGVKTIVNKTGTRDISQIIRTYSSRTFGFASENFYACFLAALEVERDARKYFGEVKWSREPNLAELKVTRPMTWKTLVAFFDAKEKATALANPHFTQRIRKGRANLPFGVFLRVPVSRLEIARKFMRGQVNATKLPMALRDTPIDQVATPGAASDSGPSKNAPEAAPQSSSGPPSVI